MRVALPLAIACLLLPTALASWQSSVTGASEPSTPYDDPTHMFVDPPMDPARERIYFDIVHVPASSADPLPHYEAMLGAWLDCNGDGIVGGASGLVYPSFMLLDLARCPPGTSRNDGAQVTEMFWIGPGAMAPHIDDPHAAVWLDALTPVQAAPSVKTSADDVMVFDPSGPVWRSAGVWATPAPAVTGYADVGITTRMFADVPHGAASIYGYDMCPTGSLGIHMNWDCNAAHWGGSPRLFDPYWLRDTDCLLSCP